LEDGNAHGAHNRRKPILQYSIFMLFLVPSVTSVCSMYKPYATAMRFHVAAVRCVFKVVVQQGGHRYAWLATATRSKRDARRKTVEKRSISNVFDVPPSITKHSISRRMAANIRISRVTVRCGGMAMVKQDGGAPRSSVGEFKCIAVVFRRKSMSAQCSEPLMPVCLNGARM
jgi:hypothetical protein